VALMQDELPKLAEAVRPVTLNGLRLFRKGAR
jgi:hypothetical protein